MKRHFMWLMITCIIFVACNENQSIETANIAVSRSVETNGTDESANTLTVYLSDEDQSSLIPYNIEVDKSDVGQQITAVIAALKSGAEDVGLKKTLPDDLLVDTINLNGNNIILHVGDGFEAMDELEFMLCRIALIKSLTAIEGINSIEFYVNGTPMRDDKGIVYGPFTPEDVITEPKENNKISYAHLILYFPDNNGELLVRVDREVALSPNESLEYRIIEELRNPPEGESLGYVLPDEAMVKSIEVNEGVCYVDFNEAFKSKHYGGASGETMTVYAIVNSLTELPNISHVQFMIEGKRVEEFKGHLDFAALFENDINLISKERRVND